MGALNEFLHKVTGKKRAASDDAQKRTWSGSVHKNISILECPFAVFDTELSGLDARKDFIVSIGAMKMTGGTIHISKEFYRLVRPTDEMSKESVEIHGITPSELKDEEGLDAVLPDFLDLVTDSVLVGHFINIDMKFINAALKKRGNKRLANPALDTHDIHGWLYDNSEKFRKHYPGATEKTDLFSVAKRYGITIDTAHNALYDAFVTAQLFQRFLSFLHAEGMHNLGELLDIGRA
jgi:DNA polymerase-3 subunit epsilon